MRVRCDVVRYFDEPQPGVVEAYLTDASGFRWQIVEKTVMFEEWRTIDSASVPGWVSISCRVSADSGGATVSVVLPGVSDQIYEVFRSDLLD